MWTGTQDSSETLIAPSELLEASPNKSTLEVLGSDVGEAVIEEAGKPERGWRCQPRLDPEKRRTEVSGYQAVPYAGKKVAICKVRLEFGIPRPTIHRHPS